MSLSKTLLGTGLAPTPLRRLLWATKRYPALFGEYLRDMRNFLAYSATMGDRSARNLRGMITESFHNIEKGLSLPNPRTGFGAAVIARLLTLCDSYIREYGTDERVLYAARDVLLGYKRHNETNGLPEYPHRQAIEAYIEKMSLACREQHGGTRDLARQDILRATDGVTSDFFFQRHSVRQFSDRDVDLALIEEAVRIALKAPAVCNRQYAHAVVIADPVLIRKTLEMQGGARGFGQGVNKLVVVTTRFSQFWGAGERNQPWVDGGLFAMSLLLGLHAQGLGTCCLNWSKRNAQTRAMKAFLGLDPDEFIVMMIAVGHLPEELKVAYSDRIGLKDGLRVLSGPGE